MTIRTEQLASTAITSATYDTETQDMSITFTSGQTYDYHGVPEDVFDGLVNSPSAGKYYHAYIKDQYS